VPDAPAAVIDAWGVATRTTDGGLSVRMPRTSTWEDYQGPRGVGQLATQMADVHLAVAESLADMKLPAALAPDVAAQASWDVMAAARMAHRDDWFALVRAAQSIPRDRFLDYVSALTAVGPLVPVRWKSARQNGVGLPRGRRGVELIAQRLSGRPRTRCSARAAAHGPRAFPSRVTARPTRIPAPRPSDRRLEPMPVLQIDRETDEAPLAPHPRLAPDAESPEAERVLDPAEDGLDDRFATPIPRLPRVTGQPRRHSPRRLVGGIQDRRGFALAPQRHVRRDGPGF
jgi:hypothetical protein